MNAPDHLRARLAMADPLAVSPAEVAVSPWGMALLEGIVATDPAERGMPTPRPVRRPALRMAVAVALAVALAAGGAVAAYRLLTPSEPVQRGVDTLTLPAPDVSGLTPVPGSLTPLLRTEARGGTWDLWSVRTRDRGTLLVVGVETATGPEQVAVGACPEPAGPSDARVCLAAGTAFGDAVVGRAPAGAVGVRAVYGDGSTVDGAVGTGVFLVVGAASAGAPLGLPERIEALDAAGAVMATIPAGRPGG